MEWRLVSGPADFEAEKGTHVLQGLEDGEVVVEASWVYVVDSVRVTSFTVAPDRRGEGLARVLSWKMREVLAEFYPDDPADYSLDGRTFKTGRIVSVAVSDDVFEKVGLALVEERIEKNDVAPKDVEVAVDGAEVALLSKAVVNPHDLKVLAASDFVEDAKAEDLVPEDLEPLG